MQPLLPRLAYLDAIVGMLIQEHLVVLGNQPAAQFSGRLSIVAGVAEGLVSNLPVCRQS